MGDLTFIRPQGEFTCPQCGWSGEFATRFPAWCMACTYGAEAGFVPQDLGRRARRRNSVATKRSDQLYTRVEASAQLRPTGPLRATVLGVAALIHLATLALLAGGVALLLLKQPTSLGWFLGLPMVAVAYTLRPRFQALDKDEKLITQAEAPELFGLLDEIADLLQTTSFTGVRLAVSANAATAVFGIYRERLLIIGVPLWELLSPQQRVALLAHEVAHGANADAEYGLVVGSALHTLRRWYAVTHPLTFVTARTRLRTRNAVDVILPIHIFYRTATALLRRTKPRAEYLADGLAAQVASTEAICEVLDRAVTAAAAMQVLSNAIRARVPSQPWRIVRDYAAALPEHEHRRLALLDERAGSSIDATHPPTHLRIKLLRARPALPAQLTMTAERSALIDAELAGRIDELGKTVIKFARR